MAFEQSGVEMVIRGFNSFISGILGAWNFSVDSLDPVKYEKLRGVHDALPEIMKAIDTVRRAGAHQPEFRMNYLTVITRDNFREIPGLVSHCVDTGIASIYLMNVYGDTTGRALLTVPEICEFRDEVVPAVLTVLREKNTPEIVQTNAADVLGTFFSGQNPDENYARGVYWPDADSVRQACRVPNFYTLIEPDGRALPCCLVEISHEGEVGNVMEQPLADVWNGESFEAFRRDRIPFCQRCSSPRNMTLGLVPKMCRQFRD